MKMNLRTIADIMRYEWEFTIAGLGFAILFLPMHTIRPDEFWTITRMWWWIPFLVYINELHREYKKNNKLIAYRLPSVWHPTDSAWVNRWGVSWRTLIIVIPTMLVMFFFVMLVVFA